MKRKLKASEPSEAVVQSNYAVHLRLWANPPAYSSPLPPPKELNLDVPYRTVPPDTSDLEMWEVVAAILTIPIMVPVFAIVLKTNL